MHIFHSIADLRSYLRLQRQQGKSVGFVPTMGALHEGHLSLLEASKVQNDVTICSIFVNPIQFNNPDDLARYPRTLDADCAMLAPAGCDAVFAPSAEEMYGKATASDGFEPSDAVALPLLKFDFGDLERVMEGQFRPGHFNGVGIVVSKLFNIVQPDRTYFGQKDLQQLAVIRRMMIDLGFQIALHPCPTLREADGLAMSSRNRNLTPKERALAPHIFKGLMLAKRGLISGKTTTEVKLEVAAHFNEQPAFRLEYFEIVDAHSLQTTELRLPEAQTALCIAAHLGKVRLIDNVVF
ncbi:pantoate--beta-alanine ligase [Runella slithyformis]|uniref:Pantothenate synthetase n=1 Tax=Runella slithyformis (strain ATCC 29530 / DSM 19594 / LMG 11500 / NCIMB 11436 / LSU 4) TaxID=761193 RepID=A0A7U4E4P1_RUNSL|nr:pantoate--beta-alanine ligase [Runella slithyformis]AEI47353.1 Pantothenate synthetase [Runella slithyformis DSM 19594]